MSYKKEVSEDGTKITQTITNTKIVTKLNLIKVEKNNEKNLLKNAEFALYTANDNYTYEESNRVTGNIKTDSNGRATVNGLVPGKYVLKETKAPEGYSINVDGASATIKESKDKNVTVPTSLKDTKLSALPSTGGIGTTIFTIAGCLIMVTAAGLFFASRKRTNK